MDIPHTRSVGVTLDLVNDAIKRACLNLGYDLLQRWSLETPCLSHCSQELAKHWASGSGYKESNRLPSPCVLHSWSGGATAIILRCNVTHLLVMSVKVLDFKHWAIFPTPLKMAAGGGLGTRLNIVAPTNTLTSTIVIRTRSLDIFRSHRGRTAQV